VTVKSFGSPPQIIPAEGSASAKRWEMPEFSESAVATEAPGLGEAEPPVEASELRLPTTAEIEAVYAKAAEEGRAAGYAEGQQLGRREALQAAATDIERLRQILRGLAVPVDRLDAAVEQALLSLALEIARQVVRHELTTQPELILPLLREALKALPIRSRRPLLRLHPEDVALLREALPELADEGVETVADPDLERGGLILAVPLEGEPVVPDRRWGQRSEAAVATELDLSLATRWRQVLEQLFGDLAR